MSKYDQRMLKPRSNLLYFQLIPNYLHHSTKPIPPLKHLHFKLIKSTQYINIDQQVCDQSKKPIPVLHHNNQLIISRVFINFNISLAHPLQNISSGTQYKLVLYGGGNGDGSGDGSGDMVGEFVVDVMRYMREFQENDRKFVNETVVGGQEQGFGLNFDVFIEKTRFMLQKFVRSSITPLKQKQDIRIDKFPYFHKLQPIPQPQNNPSPQSQKPKSNKQPIIFISPYRSVQKNRKLIIRHTKIVPKYNTTIMQQDSAAFSKSYNKQESANKKQVNANSKQQQTNNKQQQTNNKQWQVKCVGYSSKPVQYLEVGSKDGYVVKVGNSQIDDSDPLADIQHSPQHNRQAHSYILDDELQIKLTKSQTSRKTKSKSAQTTTHNPDTRNAYEKKDRPKSKSKTKTNIKKIKQVIQEVPVQLQTSSTEKDRKKTINNATNLKAIAFYVCFILLSAILLLQVMSPSRKV